MEIAAVAACAVDCPEEDEEDEHDVKEESKGNDAHLQHPVLEQEDAGERDDSDKDCHYGEQPFAAEINYVITDDMIVDAVGGHYGCVVSQLQSGANVAVDCRGGVGCYGEAEHQNDAHHCKYKIKGLDSLDHGGLWVIGYRGELRGVNGS